MHDATNFAVPSSPTAAASARKHKLDLVCTGADRIAFEIGWDYAHHRLVPPPDHLHAGHPVRHGWEAGQAIFGVRTLQATPQVRKWLQLRLGAWARGKAFERVGVTPAFLKRIDVPVCPITGEALTHGTGTASDASVDRVNNVAGYAVGNLAVMSVRANGAKSDYDWHEAASFARQIERGRLGQIDGLTAHQWARLAVLMSFCTPLSHAEAAGLPLLVMPPARLRVLNPAQVLQILLTLRFMHQGQPARVDRVAAFFPPVFRNSVVALMTTLLSRCIAAGPGAGPVAVQRAMEAAWAKPTLLRRWQAVAGALTARQCEQIVERLVAARLAHPGWRCLPTDQATEGWALETGGLAADEDECDRSTAIVPGAPDGAARPISPAAPTHRLPVAGRATAKRMAA